MPVIESAKKKLRQDKKRTNRNDLMRVQLKSLLKKATKEKSAAAVTKVFVAVDKAAKNHIIHKNKAARLKSRMSKLLSIPTPTKETKEKATPAKRTKSASK